MDDEKLKMYVRYGLIGLFACLVAYGFITGGISGDKITDIFTGLIE